MVDLQIWLVEFAKAFGRLFLNPMLYWGMVVILIAGSKRINREREQFGSKVFPMYSEMKQTWLPSIIFGILISVLYIGLGVVFPYQAILLLSFIVILLSIHTRFTLLSASYTIGLTFFLIILSPFILKNQTIVDPNLFTNTPLISMALLIGILLLAEAFLLKRIDRNETYPNLVRSERGRWIGRHHLKKLSMIPFFVLIPTDQLGKLASFLPYYPVEGESYSIILVPFLLGFDIYVQSSLPSKIAARLSSYITILGLIVILLAVSSIFIPWLSLAAVIVAVLGREYIIYKHKVSEENKKAYFTQIDDGLKVLSIIPNSPAANLGILIGERIVRVNGTSISTTGEFYEALQSSGAYYKLDVIDDSGEIRFVQNAFYAGDHYKLGLIFIQEPHYKKRTG